MKYVAVVVITVVLVLVVLVVLVVFVQLGPSFKSKSKVWTKAEF